MSMEIRCNICGRHVEEETEAAENWWNVACWKRKAKFTSLANGGKHPSNPDDAFGKDVCPECMPALQGALSSNRKRP